LINCLIFLGACHTIVMDQRKNEYSASSPDELALVNFAKQCGYEFLEIDAYENLVMRVKG